MPTSAECTTPESASKKLPAIQFYPGDWKRDPGVQSLGFFDRGVWMEILFLMHESSERGVLLLNGRPMSEQALANCLGLDKQILTTTLTTIIENGVASRREDGALINRRMVRDEEIRQERIKAGHKGGNPRLLKQSPTPQVNQIPTPSSSSSSSSSSSDLKEEEREEGATAPSAPAQEPIAPKPKLHPSPLAPKRLRRKKEELLPYPDDESPIFLTNFEVEKLLSWFKYRGAEDPQGALDSLVNELDLYYGKKAFDDYVDHYRTLLKWAKNNEKRRAND